MTASPARGQDLVIKCIDKGPRLGERGDQGVQNGRALGAYRGAVAVEEDASWRRSSGTVTARSPPRAATNPALL